MSDFLDSAGFVWWHGVVEDRNDPLQLGRCRVRILMWHPSERKAVEIDQLPWAFPMQPIQSAAMSGIGYSPIGPVEGTWVIGFFRDGENAQDPVMLGTIGGIPQNFPGSDGFNDPNQVYPLSNLTFHGLGEPDTNRLARTIGTEILGRESKEHPVVTQKSSTTPLFDESTGTSIPYPGVPIESEGGDIRRIQKALAEGDIWVEPPTDAPFAQYPHNHVFETEAGHIQEFDDTEGHERIHTFHTSGTFVEMQPGGDKLSKIVGDGYEIIQGDDNVYVKGNLNITVDQQARLLVNNDLNIEVKPGESGAPADVKVVVRQGDVRLNIENGNMISQINGNMINSVSGDKTEIIKGNYTLTVDGQYFMNAGTVFIRGGSIFLN